MHARPLRATTATVLAALIAAGCATRPVAESGAPPDASAPGAATAARDSVALPERFVSGDTPGELDSLATWPTPEGGLWVIATAKGSHELVVFDGGTGARLRTVGRRGEAPGEFIRPNGIAVHGDLALVVERDGHRVQAFRLPGFEPAGIFGADELRSPYGIWLHETGPGELEVFVTDSFMYGEAYDVVPGADELDERVRRFEVVDDGAGPVRARLLGSFGDTGAGALRKVESIAGDPAHRRLLIADEFTPGGSTLRDYGFDGRYAGRSLPSDSFAAEAEGVALWTCDGGDPDVGYWVAVDQISPLTTFHLFERDGLALVASFTGEATSWTDGIALHAAATPAFPAGALYAVHADKAVAAFDLADVARTLGLAPECAL
ncbi:NHL repeat-containing protein [Luteimonas pelagia]